MADREAGLPCFRTQARRPPLAYAVCSCHGGAQRPHYADQNGFLGPLPIRASRCRASLYTDELVVFLTPVQGDVAVMKEILRIFGEASGLFTNVDKLQVPEARPTY